MKSIKKSFTNRNWGSYEVLDMTKYCTTADLVEMIRMSDVIQTEVSFLWKPYILFSKLTILQGNPGEGKASQPAPSGMPRKSWAKH